MNGGICHEFVLAIHYCRRDGLVSCAHLHDHGHKSVTHNEYL